MDAKMVRRRKRLFRLAVDTFIDLLQQVGKRRVDYRATDADVKSWDSFMEYFGEKVSEDFVKKFVTYGIQSWFNSGAKKDYTRSIRFNWVCGKSAIERWNKYDLRTNIYITRIGLKKDHNIVLEKRKSEVSKFIGEIRPVEEGFKGEYHNSKRGYLWCVANTTLYNHKSSWCVNCLFKNECKELLKTEFPRVYTKRGYGER